MVNFLKPGLFLRAEFGFCQRVDRTLTPLDFLNALRCGAVISAVVGSWYPAIAYQFLYLNRDQFRWGDAVLVYLLAFVPAFVVLALLVHLFPGRLFKWSRIIQHRESLILTMLGCVAGSLLGVLGLVFVLHDLTRGSLLSVHALSVVTLFVTTGACYGTLLGASAAGLLELRKRRP